MTVTEEAEATLRHIADKPGMWPEDWWDTTNRIGLISVWRATWYRHTGKTLPLPNQRGKRA